MSSSLWFLFTFYLMRPRPRCPASCPASPVESCPINTVSGAARLPGAGVPTFEKQRSHCRCSLSLSWRSRRLRRSRRFPRSPSAGPSPGPGSCTASGSSSLEPSQSAGSYLMRVSWSWSCWSWRILLPSLPTRWTHSLRSRRVTVAEQPRPAALLDWQDQNLEDSGPAGRRAGSCLKIYLKIY